MTTRPTNEPTTEQPFRTNDPRDVMDVDPGQINAAINYAMYSVFRVTGELDGAARGEQLEATLTDLGVTVRGWYDVAGFRADADLMLWALSPDPQVLQAAYHAVRRSPLGRHLEGVWSVLAVHRQHEFNKVHVPASLSGIAPRPWLCVYPFVRSYDWYSLDPDHRAKMLKEHGMAARGYPDVLGSTMSTFALSDYEWILAFEADELNRITDMMRELRAVEARLHVREEVPFFTGPRVSLAEWADRQA